jgi:hypothetical protein
MSESHKGKKRPPMSLDQRKKLSAIAKADTARLDRCKKMSEAQRGKQLSEEHRKKIGISGRGRRYSEESKRKKSASLMGHDVSEETRRRISEANRGKERIGSKGSLNPAWKGGITPENIRLRNSLDGKAWKRACLERDSFTCQKTGQHGGDLEVHHINNFADFPELRLAIDNGITISKEAHKLFHQKYGRRNNTKEQLEEFLNQ